MRQPLRQAARVAIALLIAGAVFGVGFVGGWAVYPATHPGPGKVILDGFLINISYAPGTLQNFGPNSTEVCGVCPVPLTGGTYLNLSGLSVNVFLKNTGYFNVTVYSGVTFVATEWSGGGPPPLIHYYDYRNWTIGGGTTLSWPVELAVPNPAPSIPGGFWVLMNVTSNVVRPA